MGKLQILVATMGQDDFSLAERMNLRSDAILANQTDTSDIQTKKYPFGTVKMISTTTRGVGINRNIAILASDAEILLFADDDITYRAETAERVIEAFQENPKADVIIFSMDYTRDGEVIERLHLKKKRLHIWNAMRYGACALAIRRNAVLRSNILFNQLFGGGCLYGSGEDSLFLRDCFKNRLSVYSHDYVLGTCSRDSSSWFSGCNEKYFYDKGALLGLLFPHMSHLMVFRFAICFKKSTSISCLQRIRLMLDGKRGGKALRPYQTEDLRKEKSK